MGDNNLPKVLIVSRGVWDDTKGTSSTLTNLFQNYDADKLAHIYIETKSPNTSCCNVFFQISEYSLIQKIFSWRTKTGFIINSDSTENIGTDEKNAKREENTMRFVRKHRSIFFNFIRELIWLLNGWKSNELNEFITGFNPDVIWLDGSPLILMNRISNFIQQESKKPSTIFLMDDVYTYQSCNGNFLHYLYKFLLRKSVKRVVSKCNEVFVCSPKMKKEYDAIFDVDSIFITKGIDLSKVTYKPYKVNKPIKLVYLGQVIYGRIFTLMAIAQALKKINSDGVKMQLFIYTNNTISTDLKNKLLVKDSVYLMNPVPYNVVPNIIADSDVVVFVESFEKKSKNIARLSFSTKITDYLSSGKCILAIGPDDIAPIEYFVSEDAAIVITDKKDILCKLDYLSNQDVINEYSLKANECASKNHDVTVIDNVLKSTMRDLSFNTKDKSHPR